MNPVADPLFWIGLVLLLAALAWRAAARPPGGSASLRRALRDPDPAVRRTALTIAAQRGLAENASLLLELSRLERDPSVVEALADAVVRNQWEPTSSVALVRLRLWAQEQVDRAQRETPAPEKVAPVGAPVNGQVPDGAAREAMGARRNRRGPTVLVTGAGGPAGVAVIRALRQEGVHVLAAGADELAVGLQLADDVGVLPPAYEPTFVDRLCSLAQERGATAVISTVAEEMLALAAAEEELAAAGLATWLPDRRALELCVDKWLFACALREASLPTPPTALATADGIPGPWIVKPRFGRGSRDVYGVDGPDDLSFALARVPEPIVQTRVSGLEFTVDALVDRHGVLAGAVPRWRLETKAGISTKGRTFEDEALRRAVAALLAAVGLRGPANVQGFLQEDGSLVFIEANPRFSGGLPLSLAAGADLVGQYLRGVVDLPILPQRLAYRPGVTMTRHHEDVFL